MTEHTKSAIDDADDDFDPAMAADLELIVDALNGHLSPERVAEVTRRLEEDPAFREFAAPMLLTWSVPTYLERHPRPVGELENAWNAFAERAGIAQPPVKKSWRRHPLWRWIRFPLLAFLVYAFGPLIYIVITAMGLGFPLSEVLFGPRPIGWDFQPVQPMPGWMDLGDSIQVLFVGNSELRVERKPKEGVRRVLLMGQARFRVLALDSLTPEPRRSGIIVYTRGGVVSAGESEFTVNANGDVTDVQVHRPSRRRFLFVVPLPTEVAVRRDTADSPMILRELDRARLVKGRTPERLATQP